MKGKRSKKTILGCLLLAAVCCLSGCGLVDEGELPQTERELRLEGDFLCGFWVIADETLDKIVLGEQEPQELFEAQEGIACAYVERKSFDSGRHYYSTEGWGLSCDFDQVVFENFPLDDRASGGLAFGGTIYFTQVFSAADQVFSVWGVYYNEERGCFVQWQEIGLGTGSMGSSGITFSQDNRANSTDSDGNKQEIVQTCTVDLRFELVDTLVGVNVKEYDGVGELIASGEYDRENGYTASEACAFVIVEKQYVDRNGESYLERTVAERDKKEQQILYYPLENGLVELKALDIGWGSDKDEEEPPDQTGGETGYL